MFDEPDCGRRKHKRTIPITVLVDPMLSCIRDFVVTSVISQMAPTTVNACSMPVRHRRLIPMLKDLTTPLNMLAPLIRKL
jgi:hypothetical protein